MMMMMMMMMMKLLPYHISSVLSPAFYVSLPPSGKVPPQHRVLYTPGYLVLISNVARAFGNR